MITRTDETESTHLKTLIRKELTAARAQTARIDDNIYYAKVRRATARRIKEAARRRRVRAFRAVRRSQEATMSTRHETITALLDKLHDLSPRHAEIERQAMGCTVPEDNENYQFALADLREVITEAEARQRGST